MSGWASALLAGVPVGTAGAAGAFAAVIALALLLRHQARRWAIATQQAL